MTWLVDAYQKSPDKDKFFGKTFTIHAGSPKLEEQLRKGMKAEEIEQSWQAEIKAFKKIRAKHLLYE